jgi:hypothetical protein
MWIFSTNLPEMPDSRNSRIENERSNQKKEEACSDYAEQVGA